MSRFESNRQAGRMAAIGGMGVLGALLVLIGIPIFLFTVCMVDVPSRHMAVFVHKPVKISPTTKRSAPSPEYKGVQRQVMAEGWGFYNPWTWDWIIVPQPDVEPGKVGVRIRLYGDNLGPGEIIARTDSQKGIIPEVLKPGRHLINAYVVDRSGGKSAADIPQRGSFAEHIEIWDLVDVPAGFVGVVTNLTGPMPQKPNEILAGKGERGVQAETYGPGQREVNPYVERVDLVDCRSQRFNLSEDDDMGFPSKDGFWVMLDGVIEFRIKPEDAPRVLVVYNEIDNDQHNSATIDKEIVNKIILPNARSFCRLKGSDHSGKDFITGDTRSQFQKEFQTAMEEACESQGIEIIQALITKIIPPEQFADPVRKRQIAVQEELRFHREIKQQTSEQQLAIEKEMVTRKQAIVAAGQEVIILTTEAKQKQQVAIIDANQRFKVAEFDLKAAKDMAEATMSRGKADAQVVEFQNAAEAAGWKQSIQAFNGRGDEFARGVMLKKLARIPANDDQHG